MTHSFLPAICSALLLFLLSVSSPSQSQEGIDAWEQLKQGKAIAIMRHALAPGTGDPANFDVRDCSTQRNLSAEGRAQSRTIGTLFKSQGIDAAQIFSSQWCRCQETARLLDLGSVSTLSALNSFFEDRSSSASQTKALEDLLPEWLQAGSMPTVLVTHQVNISALTGRPASSGEILIITSSAGEIVVLDSINTLD